MSHSIWTKVCGIRRLEDALVAMEVGVDAIGLVFVAKSPRVIDIQTAQTIVQACQGQLTCVGLFLDPDPEMIDEVLRHVRLDCLQFHGQESVTFCEQWALPYIKAFGQKSLCSRPQSADAWIANIRRYQSADKYLIDSHATGQMGGTGLTGDWSELKSVVGALDRPWVLAGGLNPSNVNAAIQMLNPDGIDLSSGVESQPGIKDHGKIRSLMTAINPNKPMEPSNG